MLPRKRSPPRGVRADMWRAVRRLTQVQKIAVEVEAHRHVNGRGDALPAQPLGVASGHADTQVHAAGALEEVVGLVVMREEGGIDATAGAVVEGIVDVIDQLRGRMRLRFPG